MNTSGIDNLNSLFWLRNIAIVTQISCILLSLHYFQMNLPIITLIALVGLLVLFNVYTRIRISLAEFISSMELFAQLSVDVVVLTALLALTGGATNPFAILYLLPLAFAAIILPYKYTWAFALFTVIAYSLIVFFYFPMPGSHSTMSEFNLHVIGMWLGFILSAFIISHFVLGLRQIIDEQHVGLNKARETELKNDQLIKLGILSASTAHAIGTPLNNMTLLIDDIRYEEAKNQKNLIEKLALMDKQIMRCREALVSLDQSSGNVSLTGGARREVNEYLASLIKNWQLTHPEINIALNFVQSRQKSSLIADKTLDHALINILDNAAQASEEIEISVVSEMGNYILYITDQGPGIAQSMQSKIGKQALESKNGGLGLGLFLSNAIIERLGGSVKFVNLKEGGLCTKIKLPMVI